MKEHEDAVLVEKPKYELVKLGPVEATINELVRKFDNIVYDLSTKAGYATAIADRAELRTNLSNLEAARKDEKADVLERGRYIDATAGKIKDLANKYYEPLKKQIKDHDDEIASVKAEKAAADQKRKEQIQARIQPFREIVAEFTGRNSEDIRSMLHDYEDSEITEDEFQEFTDEADMAKRAALAGLNTLLTNTIAQEEEQARILAERAELEELRAKQAAMQAEFDAARLAEEKRVAAEREKIEQERRDHEAKMKAEEAERLKIEAVKGLSLQAYNQSFSIERTVECIKDLERMECAGNSELIIAVDRELLDLKSLLQKRMAEQAEETERNRIAAEKLAEEQRIADEARLARETEEKQQREIAEAARKEAEKKAKAAEKEKKLAMAKCKSATDALKRIHSVCMTLSLSSDEMLTQINLICEANI